MAIRKAFALSASTLSLALLLASCGASLGKFDEDQSYETYYASFGDVKGLFDGGSHEYDIEDSLFNETTLEEMKWDDDDDAVKEEEYLYLVLPFEDALTISSIALNVKTTTDVSLELSLFYFVDDLSIGTKFRYLTSPEKETIYDTDGNPIGEQVVDYDEPPLDLAIQQGAMILAREEWSVFGFSDFNQRGFEDGYLHTLAGGSLYIRVENNSGWRKDELEPVSFTFINLLVRAE